MVPCIMVRGAHICEGGSKGTNKPFVKLKKKNPTHDGIVFSPEK